jgi:hypothetical protein
VLMAVLHALVLLVAGLGGHALAWRYWPDDSRRRRCPVCRRGHLFDSRPCRQKLPRARILP